MKGLSVLFILQGLSIIYESLNNMFHERVLIILNYTVSPIVNATGLVLGVLFVYSGISMLFKKRYSYYLSFLLCCIFTIYLFSSLLVVLYLKINSIILILVLLLFILIYLTCARYLLTHKSYFQEM